MGEVVAYHPGTGAEVVVDAGTLEHHLRASGWMTREEWDEHQARLAEREQPAEPAAKTAEGKTAESEGK